MIEFGWEQACRAWILAAALLVIGIVSLFFTRSDGFVGQVFVVAAIVIAAFPVLIFLVDWVMMG